MRQRHKPSHGGSDAIVLEIKRVLVAVMLLIMMVVV
jgi:hypothetical protein